MGELRRELLALSWEPRAALRWREQGRIGLKLPCQRIPQARNGVSMALFLRFLIEPCQFREDIGFKSTSIEGSVDHRAM
jgi:hypothetical protein